MLHVLPLLCNSDFFGISEIHGSLIRCGTCGNSAACDYLVVGSENPIASEYKTFAVLGEIRKRCTEKLTRMPLGAVLEESSGALKNTLIDRIDSIETTLARIVPEFTANFLIPVIILVYIFMIDWRMGLASLATVPLGMSCYVFMMAGSAKFYEHTVTATKVLNLKTRWDDYEKKYAMKSDFATIYGDYAVKAEQKAGDAGNTVEHAGTAGGDAGSIGGF